MVRRVYFTFIIIILLLNYCSSKQYYDQHYKYLKYSIPEEFKKTGFVSSSTYQLYFQVRADSYKNGLLIAKKEAVKLAFEYLLQEPILSTFISQTGRQRIRQMIYDKGKIKYFRKIEDSDDLYEVVVHISDIELKKQLKQIK